MQWARLQAVTTTQKYDAMTSTQPARACHRCGHTHRATVSVCLPPMLLQTIACRIRAPECEAAQSINLIHLLGSRLRLIGGLLDNLGSCPPEQAKHGSQPKSEPQYSNPNSNHAKTHPKAALLKRHIRTLRPRGGHINAAKPPRGQPQDIQVEAPQLSLTHN